MYIHVLMRDEKEERKKEASKVKQCPLHLSSADVIWSSMTRVTMTPSSHVTATVPPVQASSSSRYPNLATTVWEPLVSAVYIHLYICWRIFSSQGWAIQVSLSVCMYM